MGQIEYKDGSLRYFESNEYNKIAGAAGDMFKIDV